LCFAVGAALPANLAAAHPEQQATRQQAVKEEGNHPGKNGWLVGCDEQGDIKPANGNDVHAVIMH
jgi:hypothetical protein